MPGTRGHKAEYCSGLQTINWNKYLYNDIEVCGGKKIGSKSLYFLKRLFVTGYLQIIFFFHVLDNIGVILTPSHLNIIQHTSFL